MGENRIPPLEEKAMIYKKPSPKGMTCLIANQLLLLSTTLRGYYRAAGNGITVDDVGSPDCNTLGTVRFSFLLVFLQASWTFGTFFMWGKVEDLVDLLL